MIALSLRLATFETARQEDRHHTLLMAAILVVLGTGALYFIFIVQNYYLVDRTLDRMKTYTENVVESMADGLVSIDREGKIVTLNRQAGEILGSGRERLEGKTIASVLGEGIGRILGSAEGQALVRDRELEIHKDKDEQDSPQPQRGAASGREGTGDGVGAPHQGPPGDTGSPGKGAPQRAPGVARAAGRGRGA